MLEPGADNSLEACLSLVPFTGSDAQLQTLAQLWRDETHATWVRIHARCDPLSSTSSVEQQRLIETGIPLAREWVLADTSPITDAALAQGREVVIVGTEGQPLAEILLGNAPVAGPGEATLLQVTTRLLQQWANTYRELQRQKLEALAEFSAGAGHEINNPIATITGRVQLLLAEERHPERRRALQTIGGQALRIRDMIGDLMLFARPPQPHRQLIDVQTWLPQILPGLQQRVEDAGCRLQVQPIPPAVLQGDPTQLAVALTALIRNSLEASSEGQEVLLEVQQLSSPPMLLVAVSDEGRGLSDQERIHLFDPFFSGRQAGRGLGFGLSKVWRIMQLHAGEVQVLPRSPRGLIVQLRFPLAVE